MDDRDMLGERRRPVLEGAEALGPVDPNQRITVTLVLRSRTPFEMPQPGHHLTCEAHAERHGATAEELARVTRFAGAGGFDIVEVSAARRTVRIAGTAARLEAAFHVKLERQRHRGIEIHTTSHAPRVPESLADVVIGVFGLDTRPLVQPHVGPFGSVCDQQTPAFFPAQIAQAYNFPAMLSGAGQTVAIIEVGGGFRMADLHGFFLDLRTPSITTVSVDGATNQPPSTPPTNYDFEIMLDLQIIGQMAPLASMVVYFTHPDEQGIVNAFSTVLADTIHRPSVLSISWGGIETTFDSAVLEAIASFTEDAARIGMTICASSGDSGSSDGGDDARAHVSFPASLPLVLSCGGTRLSVDSNGRVSDETAWNHCGATGGGVSDVFALPSYQAGAGVPASVNPGGRVGRGVPDVAGNADPASGWAIVLSQVGNQLQLVAGSGTSAVAPLWAALFALINERLSPRRVGPPHAKLYADPAAAGMRDVTTGQNGAYSAGPGWDACTGLGSPDGTKLLHAFECGTSQVSIDVTKTNCGIYAVAGGQVHFSASIANPPNTTNIHYTWSVHGQNVRRHDVLPVGSTTDPTFIVQTSASTSAFTVTLVVTIDDCPYTASFSGAALSVASAALVERLCHLIHDLSVNFRFNPIWDPLRDLVAQPLTEADLVTMHAQLTRIAAQLEALRVPAD